MTSRHDDIANFLFEEAWLADSHNYDGWLGLWAPDAVYHVPCNDDDADPSRHIAIIYEGMNGLEDRVRRLSGGYAFAQQPRSRLSRIIGNIRTSQQEDGFEARSVFNITAFRREQMETFAGRQIHRLRPDGDGFKIVSKQVFLVNNDGYIGNMSFLL